MGRRSWGSLALGKLEKNNYVSGKLNFQTMQIGTIAPGDGVVTTISGQSKADEFLVIGSVAGLPNLKSFTVEIDGVTTLQISDTNLLNAFAQYLMEVTKDGAGEAIVGAILKPCTGLIRQNTTYRFTNSENVAKNVYAFSTEPKGVPVEAGSKTITSLSSETFEKFTALLIVNHANIDSLQIDFTSGHRDTLSVVEASALFNFTNQAEEEGRLVGGNVLVIDNSKQTFKSVRVNTSSGGQCTVLKIKLPDYVFEK